MQTCGPSWGRRGGRTARAAVTCKPPRVKNSQLVGSCRQHRKRISLPLMTQRQGTGMGGDRARGNYAQMQLTTRDRAGANTALSNNHTPVKSAPWMSTSDPRQGSGSGRQTERNPHKSQPSGGDSPLITLTLSLPDNSGSLLQFSQGF